MTNYTLGATKYKEKKDTLCLLYQNKRKQKKTLCSFWRIHLWIVGTHVCDWHLWCFKKLILTIVRWHKNNSYLSYPIYSVESNIVICNSTLQVFFFIRSPIIFYFFVKYRVKHVRGSYKYIVIFNISF